jgi:hypothetical protein
MVTSRRTVGHLWRVRREFPGSDGLDRAQRPPWATWSSSTATGDSGLSPGALPPAAVQANAETILTRLPQQLVIEPVDEDSCRVELSSDTPQALAAWLGMLGADFDVENPERHPELIEHLRQIGETYRRAAGVPGDPGVKV